MDKDNSSPEVVNGLYDGFIGALEAGISWELK